jgi:hypothetical protein
MAVYGELALEEAVDLSLVRLRDKWGTLHADILAGNGIKY